MDEIIYTFAAHDNETEIKKLLSDSQLPTVGITPFLEHFVIAKSTRNGDRPRFFA
jgi:hypothetical protein